MHSALPTYLPTGTLPCLSMQLNIDQPHYTLQIAPAAADAAWQSESSRDRIDRLSYKNPIAQESNRLSHFKEWQKNLSIHGDYLLQSIDTHVSHAISGI